MTTTVDRFGQLCRSSAAKKQAMGRPAIGLAVAPTVDGLWLIIDRRGVFSGSGKYHMLVEIERVPIEVCGSQGEAERRVRERMEGADGGWRGWTR